MKNFKIHPDVNMCGSSRGALTDKEAIYPESVWEEGEALQKVKDGFLVEVTEPKAIEEPELIRELIEDETEDSDTKESEEVKETNFDKFKKRK